MNEMIAPIRRLPTKITVEPHETGNGIRLRVNSENRAAGTG